jgi:dihydroorotase
MPLLVHGEVTDHDIDLFDREAVFIERVMRPLRRDFPELKIVFEHITTKRRRPVRGRGRRPDRRHHHRAPPAVQPQRDLQGRDQSALLLPAGAQARGTPPGAGDGRHQRRRALLPRHRLGPARVHAKESACGCAGCYTALHAMELYATAFEQAGALDKLEAFASLNGPAFYGLPVNEGTVTLKRESWTIPPTWRWASTSWCR